MALLQICQNVARSVGGLEIPTSIVNNSNPTAETLLGCAQLAGKSIAKQRGKWGAWTMLIKEYTFTTDGSADYALPSDYDRLLTDTAWDRSNYWELRGTLSPAQWQMYKSSVLGSSVSLRSRMRIRNVSGTRMFSLDPTPASGVSMVYEYVSKNWCQSSGGSGQTAWAADTDTGILDEYLIELDTLWRVLNRMGMAYAEEKEEAEQQIELALAGDGGAPKLSLNSSTGTHLIDANNVPDTGIGS